MKIILCYLGLRVHWIFSNKCFINNSDQIFKKDLHLNFADSNLLYRKVCSCYICPCLIHPPGRELICISGNMPGHLKEDKLK